MRDVRVGRHTAREAIRKLTDLGLIERRRRAGTTVIRQHPKPQFGLALDTTDQLQRYLEFTDLHVHKRRSVWTSSRLKPRWTVSRQIG